MHTEESYNYVQRPYLTCVWFSQLAPGLWYFNMLKIPASIHRLQQTQLRWAFFFFFLQTGHETKRVLMWD